MKDRKNYENQRKTNKRQILNQLKKVEGAIGFRISFDVRGSPFSYHAMSEKNKELAYIIPSIDYNLTSIEREWGKKSPRR